MIILAIFKKKFINIFFYNLLLRFEIISLFISKIKICERTDSY